MLQHTKRQGELFEMHCFTMFITVLCVIFLMTPYLTLGYDDININVRSFYPYIIPVLKPHL